MPGQNVCIRATAIERTDKVVRTLRRAGGRCLSGERRTNSSVGRESTRTTTRQCNYRYRDAKAASCMCLMHADGDKQRGCTNFWSFVVLQHCLYRDGLVCGELDGTEMLQRVRGRSWLRRTRNPCETGTVSALLALTNLSVQRLLKTKRPANRVLEVSQGVKLLTSFPVRV